MDVDGMKFDPKTDVFLRFVFFFVAEIQCIDMPRAVQSDINFNIISL